MTFRSTTDAYGRRACKSALLLLLLSGAASGDSAYELSQLYGNFEQATLTFTIDAPRVRQLSILRVELAGTQILGERDNCELGTVEISGAEVELVLRSPWLIQVVDRGRSSLPAVMGDWSHGFELVSQDPIFSTLDLGGLIEVEFRIGDLSGHLCSEWFRLPQTTIRSARLVTDGDVADRPTSWGRVKSLYPR